jgi:hypothetical protein
MNFFPLNIFHTDFENDDFAVISLRYKIETGDEVDSEDFSLFLNKSIEVIRNLKTLTKKFKVES